MPTCLHHKAFLKTLSKAQRAHLKEKTNAHGLKHLTIHASLILGFGAYIGAGLPGWQLLLVPQGVMLVFLFTLQHECTHKTPFNSLWLNELAGHVIGLIIVQPFYWFRGFHMEHHRFTNDPERDPELAGSEKPQTVHSLVLHLLTLKYWNDKFVVLIKNAAGSISDSYISSNDISHVRNEARAYLFIYACLLLFSVLISPILLWVWLIPVILGFPFLRMYLLAEHGLCPTVENMFDNTRTTFTNRLVRFVAWNMPYHTEHHILPSVPYHRLPSFHENTRAYLLSTSKGYKAFANEYVSSLNTSKID